MGAFTGDPVMTALGTFSPAEDGRAHVLLQSKDGSRLTEGVAVVLSPALPDLGAAVARHFASPLAVEAGFTVKMPRTFSRNASALKPLRSATTRL